MEKRLSLPVEKIYQMALIAKHSPAGSRRNHCSARLSDASQCSAQDNWVPFYALLLQKHYRLNVKRLDFGNPFLRLPEVTCYVPDKFLSSSSETGFYSLRVHIT